MMLHGRGARRIWNRVQGRIWNRVQDRIDRRIDRRGDPPLCLEPACRDRPAGQKAGDAAGLGRQLGAPRQPHPVIAGLDGPVIFEDHGGQAGCPQDILERRQPLPRARRIDDQQPPRIDPERRQPGGTEHPGRAGRRGRAPDNRRRIISS